MPLANSAEPARQEQVLRRAVRCTGQASEQRAHAGSGRDGDRLGSIYNFMVDKRRGRVEYAVLTFGGFLGMGGTYYPIPSDMLDYDTGLGRYKVDMDEDDLANAPSYRRGNEPDYNDDYGRMVYGYYGFPY